MRGLEGVRLEEGDEGDEGGVGGTHRSEPK